MQFEGVIEYLQLMERFSLTTINDQETYTKAQLIRDELSQRKDLTSSEQLYFFKLDELVKEFEKQAGLPAEQG